MDYREQRKENLKNLRLDLTIMKQQESLDIKKIAKENSQRLFELKTEDLKQNRKKVNNIKSSLLTSKRKVEHYWDQRRKYYTEQHTLEAYENEETKEYLEKELEKLEKVEMQMLEKLDKTQDIQNRLYDKFEACFTMTAGEIGEKQKKKEIENKSLHEKKKKRKQISKNEEPQEKDKMKN